ncbi:DUF7573 domain-containing protein [Natronococcus wangiae]|uniref:DUF7573 domain-containing protein n=1 Tax=Natronococcus wangiae TaxID=3068275 RepID=UPI00273F8F11|nr:hypothetical protein [Natronococcus sp. AD5]
MTDDATLSDFESSADSDERTARDDAATSDANRVSDGSSATESDDGTALSTYAWGAYTCARCETTTERAWRDGGAFVCPDCKSW